MQTAKHLAKHAHEFHHGINWTWSNLAEVLKDVDWQMATKKLGSCNTIAALTYHIHYFYVVTIKVFKGGPLDGNDKLSFDHPAINTQEDWDALLETVWKSAKLFSEQVASLSEEKLWETFCDEKYGNYYRNIQGVIEHSHYHLGQIAILKKLIKETR